MIIRVPLRNMGLPRLTADARELRKREREISITLKV